MKEVVKMKLKSGLVLKKIGEDAVVIPTTEKRADLRYILRLNPVAEVIFTLLLEGKNEEEIASHMAGVYNTPADIARKDVSVFLQKLKENGYAE